MTDHAKQVWQSAWASFSPWINRALLMFCIWYANEFHDDVKQLKKDVSQMRTDIEVMKKEIELLTDYNIDPKNNGR